MRLVENRPEDLEVLTDDECRWLLTRADVGRVGFTVQALPAILPVRFAVQNSRIVIPAVPNGRLATACRGAVVAFEADAWDPTGAWAVTVVGPCRVVTNRDETAALDQLGVTPWSVAESRCYVAVEMSTVTGWRAKLRAARPETLGCADDDGARAIA